MKNIKVGDIITFEIPIELYYKQHYSDPNMINTNTISTTITDSSYYPHLITAIVVATPIERKDIVIVLLWNGERMIDYLVKKELIIKSIRPYNELIEEL